MRYLRVYEWSSQLQPSSRHPGMVPLVYVSLHGDDNVVQCTRAAEELARRRQGERVLIPHWILAKELRPDGKTLDWLKVFENGLDAQRSIEWLRPLGEQLRQRGIWLDMVAADFEDGVTTWTIMGDWDPDEWERRMSLIYNSPRAFERLPQDLKRLRPRDYHFWTDPGRDAIARFNRYANSLMLDALRAVFIDSRIFDDARGRKRFKLSNYGDILPSFPVTDVNTWPLPGLATDGVSAWSAYLTEGGAAFREKQHERLWNRFIHQINITRSCTAARGTTVMPWLSSPRYFEREKPEYEAGYDSKNVWMWQEMIAHMVRSGVREFLLWNADPDLDLARRLVAETMRANDKPYSARKLDKVEFDVDEVTTRGYTTKYSDFLDAMA